jgi:hypothetical protein
MRSRGGSENHKMTVTQLITAAFGLARSRHQELHQTWIAISMSVGGMIPNSLLMASVQRSGELDMILRCMEDDYSLTKENAESENLFSFHYQMMLSEIWIGAVYEIFRLLAERKLSPDDAAFTMLSRDLRLLRIPIEKHEIAAQGQLSEPLLMQSNPRMSQGRDTYLYSKSDPKRAHIMPAGLSQRGSVMWQAIDLKSQQSHWLERRALSERMIAVWEPRPSSNFPDNAPASS